ncbi:MAG: LD-carboxypeptidase [Ferruginibacter sp.]
MIPDIHAILFGRGGYGMGRIIDQLDFRKFRKNPKWMIGFSDITVMHTHLLKNYRIASIHGPMAGAFNNMKESALYIDSLHKMITGKKTAFQCEAHPFNRKGKVTGQLVGGNLALLSNVIGTPSDFDTKNRILFIEDIGEYLYNADRMLHQLKRAGKFKNIAGLVIGGFTDMKDTTIPFGQTIEEIIRDVVSEFDFPVCYGFPVSHGTDNAPLKIGVEYQLTIDKNKSRLKEI